MRKITAITTSTWAIQEASPATPLKPNASAIRAIIKKIIAYLNMMRSSILSQHEKRKQKSYRGTSCLEREAIISLVGSL
jgi:hypothetical protein